MIQLERTTTVPTLRIYHSGESGSKVNRNFLTIQVRRSDNGEVPGGPSGKEPTCQCRRPQGHRFSLWVKKIPWRRAWQPTSLFLPGESHGQKSLTGYSP